jgi:hypothetical protein
VSYATAAELAAALRVRVTPETEPWLTACVDAASAEIDADLDRLDPVPDNVPAQLHTVCLARGVEWFKSNDAAFGVIGYAETGALRAPRDAFDRHRTVIAPYKQRWGFA